MRRIELLAKLTPDSAQALWYNLDAGYDAAGDAPATTLDAAEVRHLSAAALQVLLVAKARFAKDGGVLHLTNPSEEFLQALHTMGATTLIEEGVA
jgi:anti-anti-sigma regulatory factor